MTKLQRRANKKRAGGLGVYSGLLAGAGQPILYPRGSEKRELGRGRCSSEISNLPPPQPRTSIEKGGHCISAPGAPQRSRGWGGGPLLPCGPQGARRGRGSDPQATKKNNPFETQIHWRIIYNVLRGISHDMYYLFDKKNIVFIEKSFGRR